MSPILSIIIAVLIILGAIRLIFKMTGCLVRIIIFGIALWVILMILNMSFNFLGSIFSFFR